MSFALNPILAFLVISIVCVSGHSSDSAPMHAFMDDEQPGWRTLSAEDFTQVNSAESTWSWKDGALFCAGQPVSVLRTSNSRTAVIDIRSQKRENWREHFAY